MSAPIARTLIQTAVRVEIPIIARGLTTKPSQIVKNLFEKEVLKPSPQTRPSRKVQVISHEQMKRKVWDNLRKELEKIKPKSK